MGKEDEDEGLRRLKVAKEWIEDLSHGRTGHLIENRALRNLQIKLAEIGFFLCNYIVPHYLSDKDGNWSVGAIATVMDVVGAAAIASTEGEIKVSVDFNISYFSTAKIHEEVEIEARVVGHRGKLSSMLVEIRRKSNGEIIALGKQWMTSTKMNTKLPLTQNDMATVEAAKCKGVKLATPTLTRCKRNSDCATVCKNVAGLLHPDCTKLIHACYCCVQN